MIADTREYISYKLHTFKCQCLIKKKEKRQCVHIPWFKNLVDEAKPKDDDVHEEIKSNHMVHGDGTEKSGFGFSLL